MSQANDLERLMLGLINDERAAAGIGPLSFNSNLNDASEDHSRWMLDTDTFSHSGAGGSSAGDRIVAAGYDLEGNWSWGENIGWQSERGDPGFEDDVRSIHDSLMNSPGHRANILNPAFDEVGLGIESGDFGRFDSVMVTQNFGRTDATTEPGPMADQNDTPAVITDPDMPGDTPEPGASEDSDMAAPNSVDTAEDNAPEPIDTVQDETPLTGDEPAENGDIPSAPVDIAEDETPTDDDGTTETDPSIDMDDDSSDPVDTASDDAPQTEDGTTETGTTEDTDTPDDTAEDTPDLSDMPEIIQLVDNLLSDLRSKIYALIDDLDFDPTQESNLDVVDMLPGEAGGEPADTPYDSDFGGCGARIPQNFDIEAEDFVDFAEVA